MRCNVRKALSRPAWFVLVVLPAACLHCDIEGSAECLEDDASFVQLNTKFGGHLPERPKATHSESTVTETEHSVSIVAADHASGSSPLVAKKEHFWEHVMSAVAVGGAAALPIDHVSEAHPRRFSGRDAVLMTLKAAVGSPSTGMCIALVVFFLAVLLLYMITTPRNTGYATRQTTDTPQSPFVLAWRASTKASMSGGPYSPHFPSSGAVPAMRSSLSSASASGTQPHLFPAPPSATRSPMPQSLYNSVRSMVKPGTASSLQSCASLGPADIGKITLKVPILYIDDEEIPNAGHILKVKDNSGAERFVAKVWPPNFRAPSIACHEEVCEYLQVFAAGSEVLLCVVCGSGGKFACHVYQPGGRMYGTISEDMTLPNSEYVVGSTYTLRSAADNRRLLTILRRKGQGMQILGPPHILADVTECFDADCYEAVCEVGADATKIVLMILSMDRLVDHMTRQPAS